MRSKEILRPLAILCAVALLGFALYVLITLPADDLPAFDPENQPCGSLVISVQNGLTKEPLAGATVVIPETGQRCTTGSDGRTPVIQVPIAGDAAYADILPQTWGEITVLAYCSGYADYALLHVHVWENQTRCGPTILMFEKGATDTDQSFILTEGPHRLWVQQLLDRYRQ
ncbi:MAG: hypothetical protein PHD32_02795 [Eubacteriales bacterium]|nr:hypothetical protein [Eubacteriales bacterium]